MIEVLTSGFYTTVQDLGRPGYGSLGIPVSGAMDAYAAKWSNVILGNSVENSILELTLGKSIFLFKNQTVICVSGADFSSRLNTNPIALNTPILVKKGDIVSFNKRVFGTRAYLAVKGGFQSELILNSRSFYQGITKEHFIKKGAILPFNSPKTITEKSHASVKIKNTHFTSRTMEVYEGPEYALLNKKQKEKLMQTVFTISKDNNRMGYRLEEPLENHLEPILTSAVLPGTVQLTPSGKLIILMRDCQVTGGYPRVLQLSDNAINKLAQKTTGDSFAFKIQPLN